MSAMRLLLCSLLLCTSVASAARVSLRGGTVEDPCDPDDESYDPTDPACADYDEDEEGPTEDGDEGEEGDEGDGDDEGPGDDEEEGDEEGGKGKGKKGGKGKGKKGKKGKGKGGDGGDDDGGEDGEDFSKGEDDCHEWCPKCNDPEDPDYSPQDEECLSQKEEEEIMGDGEDSMAEEMVDVDDGPSFEDMDGEDGDGKITIDEAMEYGVAHGLSVDDVSDIFEYMDVNKDKVVDREEFESGGAQEATEDMAPGHSDLDLNGDGDIEWLEWEAGCVCGKSYLDQCGDEEFCKDIFNAADDNDDELVTKEEFDGAGEECKTADDGNCDLMALKKSAQVKQLKKFSMASWVRKHFKRSGHNLFALAQLRHQHKKGIFTKLSVLVKRNHAKKLNEQHEKAKATKQAMLFKLRHQDKKVRQARNNRRQIRPGAKHHQARRHMPHRARLM